MQLFFGITVCVVGFILIFFNKSAARQQGNLPVQKNRPVSVIAKEAIIVGSVAIGLGAIFILQHFIGL